MKTNTSLALLSVLGVLASSTVFAQPAPGDEAPVQPPSQNGPGWGRPDPETRHAALLKRYDANKDGQLDESEYAAIGRDVVAGKIGPRLLGVGPRAAGWGLRPRARRGPGYGRAARRQDGAGFGPGPRGPRALGGPGFGPRHEEMLRKYDANNDGRLDDSERAAIRKDIENGNLQRPGFGPDPRGFGPPPPPPGVDGPDAPAPEAAPEN